MEKLRIGLIGLAASVLGFAVQGCYVAQPLPECTVQGSMAYYGVTPYQAKLTETSRTGSSCPDLTQMEIGAQRYHAPGSSEFKVAIRPSRLTDWWLGYNDGLERVDPADPDGNNLIGYALFTNAFPDSNGICTLDTFTPAKQDFQEETDTLPDGGTEVLAPALSTQYDWTEFKVLNTTLIPGTAFTAKLKITEGTDCTANYDVQAFWPIVYCEEAPLSDGGVAPADAMCNPVPDPQYEQLFGSGINPEFKPKCNLDLGDGMTYGICEPTVDLATLKE